MFRSLNFSIPENVKYPEPWPRHQARFGQNCWILKHLLTDGVTFAPTRGTGDVYFRIIEATSFPLLLMCYYFSLVLFKTLNLFPLVSTASWQRQVTMAGNGQGKGGGRGRGRRDRGKKSRKRRRRKIRTMRRSRRPACER